MLCSAHLIILVPDTDLLSVLSPICWQRAATCLVSLVSGQVISHEFGRHALFGLRPSLVTDAFGLLVAELAP
jgi:hypothetical protein